jgi:hypothetical protein
LNASGLNVCRAVLTLDGKILRVQISQARVFCFDALSAKISGINIRAVAAVPNF